jgi:hypothetical protein
MRNYPENHISSTKKRETVYGIYQASSLTPAPNQSGKHPVYDRPPRNISKQPGQAKEGLNKQAKSMEVTNPQSAEDAEIGNKQPRC